MQFRNEFFLGITKLLGERQCGKIMKTNKLQLIIQEFIAVILRYITLHTIKSIIVFHLTNIYQFYLLFSFLEFLFLFIWFLAYNIVHNQYSSSIYIYMILFTTSGKPVDFTKKKTISSFLFFRIDLQTTWFIILRGYIEINCQWFFSYSFRFDFYNFFLLSVLLFFFCCFWLVFQIFLTTFQ